MAVDVPRSVIKKLIIATFCMVVLPLLTFFTTTSLGFSSIASGGLAALAANVVLIAFIVVAFTDDIQVEGDEKKRD